MGRAITSDMVKYREQNDTFHVTQLGSEQRSPRSVDPQTGRAPNCHLVVLLSCKSIPTARGPNAAHDRLSWPD